MRCVMSVTGMGVPLLRGLPDDVAAQEPPGSVVLAWERGDTRVRLVITTEQLSNLCDMVIEYIPVQEGPTDGAQPSAN